MNQSNGNLNTSTPNAPCLEQENESENKIITYAIYQVSDGTVDDFTKSILDKISYDEYDEEISKATTTIEIITIQKRYIERWKNEMHKAVEKYLSLLSQEDAVVFEQVQKQWEDSIINYFQLEAHILQNDNYGIKYVTGNAYLQDYWFQVIELFRERTIHIWYMTYLMEEGAE